MRAGLFWCLLLDSEIFYALTSKCCYSVGDARNAMLQDLRILAALGLTRFPYRKYSPLNESTGHSKYYRVRRVPSFCGDVGLSIEGTDKLKRESATYPLPLCYRLSGHWPSDQMASIRSRVH